MKLFLSALLGLSLSSCSFIVAKDHDSGEGVSIGMSTHRSSETNQTGDTNQADETVKSACSASAPRSPGQAVGVFPYAVHEKKLANDLRVLVVPMLSDGLVAYWSVVRTGSRDEVEPGVTGFAHFFEHIMFRGTEKLPGPEYDRVVNGMGADANAFTSDDITAYHLTIAKDNLPKVVEIEADRFQNLRYDETQFKTEAGAVYGEYRKSRTSPFSVLFEALQDAAFDAHTYKHTTIGFEADIQAMPEHFEYSKTFFQRFYRPENVVIVVAGDVDPAATFALIEKHYGGWKKGYVAPKVPVEPPQTAERRIDVPFDGQTLPILTLAFKGERFLPQDEKMIAGMLVGDLVFGETSAIYKKLVLDEQRVETLGTSFSPSRDPGLWAVFASVKDPADVAAVEGELWSAIEALVREGVPQSKLDEIRSRTKYSFLSSLTSPQAVEEAVAYYVAMTGGIECIDRMYATLETVTPSDVVAAAKTWLAHENATVAVLHAKDEPLPEPEAGAEPPVLMPVAADPNVVFKLWFKTGSQDDPPGKQGLAALVGGLISEGGTKTQGYDQILKQLFPLAAGYGVSVDKEMTVITGSVHRDKLDAFYGLFVDAVLNPGFRAEDFERLRENAINGIEKSLRFSSDEELGKAALASEVFRGTPYAHLDVGTVESLRSITLDDARNFWETHFTQGNLVIALGGAYPPALAKRLQADLSRLTLGAPARTPASVPAPIRGRQVLLVEKPGPSTAISFGFPIDVHRGEKDFYALWIANSWLGEHRNSSSHLYQVIREARGINYGDYSYVEAYPGGGFRHLPPTGVGRRSQMFEVWIRPVPEERAVFSLRAALREVEKLVASGLTEEQFEFTRAFLEGYIWHFADTTEARLGYAVDDRFFGLPESHLARFRRMLDEITLEDVNAAIRKHLQIQDLVIAMVTQDAAKVKEFLTSGAPSPIDYGGIEKSAEILAEDEEIERHPLGIRAENVRIVPVEEMFESSAGNGRVGALR